jgi:uncharacterized protein YndB with AHSA1/START domain
MMVAPTTEVLGPVKKSITVKKSPGEAFALFTEGIATWWPLSKYSVGLGDAQTCVFETREGGRIFERNTNGQTIPWGTVLAWEPPSRILFSWHPGYGANEATRVEVRFTAVPGGTRVNLVHTGWERLGARAKKTHDSYVTGWDHVFSERFAGAADVMETTR